MPDTGVTIGTVHLPSYRQGPTVLDGEGISWLLLGLQGWFEGWEGTGTVDQRTQADGAWVSPQYASPRVVHVKGRMLASSGTWDDVTRAWDRLQEQVPFRSLASITVSTGEGTVPDQSALVRQHEKPTFDRFGNRGEFSLSLLAPDPRKYATSSTTVTLVLPLLSGGIAPPLTPPITITGSSTVSQATLFNAGNVDSPPILEITGPCPPARVVNLTTGEALRVVDDVPAGQTLVIDVAAGTATIGGQARRVLGSWWSLVPGDNEVAFSAAGYDAAAVLDVTYRSAWK